MGVYAGYTYNRFGVEEFKNLDVNDQGFNAGLRLAVPTPLIPIDPYLKGGVVYNTLGFTFDGDDEDFIDSDNSLGFEVGAGVGIGLGPKLSFTPQVTYTRYEPKYDGERTTTSPCSTSARTWACASACEPPHRFFPVAVPGEQKRAATWTHRGRPRRRAPPRSSGASSHRSPADASAKPA